MHAIMSNQFPSKSPHSISTDCNRFAMASHTIINGGCGILTKYSIGSLLGLSRERRICLGLKGKSLRGARDQVFYSVSAMGASSSSSSSSPKQVGNQETGKTEYKTMTKEEWRNRLSQQQFYVTREKGTERAFTGEYWNTKTPGTYHCICCDTPLFESSTKFDSGTGWPSFYDSIGKNVTSELDMSIVFMPRQEVVCGHCSAHLGHVFDDGPPPTGKRYCINSAALRLESKAKE